MIIKATVYVELDGHPGRSVKYLSTYLSAVASNYLSKNNSKILKNRDWEQLDKSYPDVTEITFISHEDVLEHLRKGH